MNWLCTGSGAETSFLTLTTSRHPNGQVLSVHAVGLIHDSDVALVR